MREILHVILHVILREDGDMRASQDAPQGRRWERSYQSQLRARPLARYPLTQAHQQTPSTRNMHQSNGKIGDEHPITEPPARQRTTPETTKPLLNRDSRAKVVFIIFDV